jgi:hypothetical protein
MIDAWVHTLDILVHSEATAVLALMIVASFVFALGYRAGYRHRSQVSRRRREARREMLRGRHTPS